MPIHKLKEFLDAHGVKYLCISHSPAYTAQEVAASAHIPGRSMAKVVIVDLDGELVMAVLPATRKVVLQDLRALTGCEHARFAPEETFQARFPDCEIGAMPPFGNLYGMKVYAAESLRENPRIAFNAGSHTEVIQITWSDFERLVKPTVAAFTT
ncbi:MAG: YbaK/EbsC family protein [Verrucomicrobiota bacterium]|nr:YbaK/EbsC family protein [Limisphaera sp.]MDW8380935.1 YbaK/EbsC family protein [Verrucomicrobiota bacterium]